MANWKTVQLNYLKSELIFLGVWLKFPVLELLSFHSILAKLIQLTLEREEGPKVTLRAIKRIFGADYRFLTAPLVTGNSA